MILQGKLSFRHDFKKYIKNPLFPLLRKFQKILVREVQNFACMNVFLNHLTQFMNANLLVIKKGHIPFFSERKVTREHFKMSYSQTFMLALLMIGALLVYYAFLQNQNATQGYNIRTLQAMNRELVFKENLLDIRIAEGRSIDAVMSADIMSRMRNSENSSFLVMTDLQFAVNY